MTKITDTFHEDHYTVFVTNRSVLLRMRKFSDIFVEKFKTHSSCTINIFHS